MNEFTLDPDQRTALTAILSGGSRRVFGAPGTGKTSLVIETLAALAERDGPDSVRVVTPSRQSATRLRDELSLRVNHATLGPLARSISSFAYSVVAEHRGPSFPVRLISGGEQDSDIKHLLDGEIKDGSGGYWPDTLGSDVRQLREFRTQLRDLLSRSRDAGLVAELPSAEPLVQSLADRGHVHGIPEWVAAARFLDTYLRLSAKARSTQIDPAAIIDEATAIVTRDDRIASVRTIIVDDAHDLTVAQWRFLAAWHQQRGPVIAFGDPDLAISGFRGATPTIFSGAENVGGQFWNDSVTLTHIHRNGGVVPHVLGVVASAIPGAPSTRRAYPDPIDPAAARLLSGFSLQSATAASPAGELDLVARYIAGRVADGIAPDDIAVIVRSGSLAESIVGYLTAQGIPAHGETTGSPLRDHPVVDALLTTIEVGIDPTLLTVDKARCLLTGPLGRLSSLDYRRFRRTLRVHAIGRNNFATADTLMLDALLNPAGSAESIAQSDAGVALIARLIGAVSEHPEWQVDELLWLVWSQSGRAETWAAESRGTGPVAARAHESLDAVLTLFRVATTALEKEPTETVGVFLDRVLGQHVPDDSLTPRATAGSVSVCTPAAASGRQFDTVVVAGVNEGVWPNVRVRSALVKSTLLPFAVDGVDIRTIDQRPGIIGDELRQFLVAVSRATSAMLVTAVSSEDESPSGLFRIVAGDKRRDEETGPDTPAENSRATVFSPHRIFTTISELVGHARRVLVDPNSPDTERTNAAQTLRILADKGVKGADPADWLGVDFGTPIALFDGQRARLSPSGLKSFDESPVDWFVAQVAGGSAGIDAAVGTLVHEAVEKAPTGSATEIQATINDRWGELAFEAPWQGVRWDNLANKMATAMAEYIRLSANEGFTPVANEGHISVDVIDADSSEPVGILSGSIDRVEFAEPNNARIIDIKTGKTPESAKDHMQLKAYQWALGAGAIAELPDGVTSAGAGLLYPRVSTSQKLLFTLKVQPALTDEQLSEFGAKLVEIARRMASESFEGPRIPKQYGRTAPFDAQWVRTREVGADE